MGTVQSRRHSLGESLSPSKDSSFFDLNFGKKGRNYTRHNSSDEGRTANHIHKRHFLDLNHIISGASNSLKLHDATQPYQRPRSKTISQTNPSNFTSPAKKGDVYTEWYAKKMGGVKVLPTVFRWITKVDSKVLEESIVSQHHNQHSPKTVYLVGSWDNWKSKIPLVPSQGDFTTIIEIPEGRYEYKFLVDNKWQHNNHMPTVGNAMGGRNNVIHVKKSDFEVFDALADDFADTESQYRHSSDSSNGVSTGGVHHYSHDKGYTQDIPSTRLLADWDRLFGTTSSSTSSGSVPSSGPPFLPPQLLQVLLNKDIPFSYEPELLPEPTHVMINHLYALSIKDGVMVLSCTHRHHKKYVTTLMYKPVIEGMGINPMEFG